MRTSGNSGNGKVNNSVFQPGWKGGPGRPPKPVEQGEMAALSRYRHMLRHEILSRNLIKRMGDMAEGKGKYRKMGIKFQHQVTIDMVDRGFGRPSAINLAVVNASGDAAAVFIKRVIGIQESDL
jgi:hypothetical protein